MIVVMIVKDNARDDSDCVKCNPVDPSTMIIFICTDMNEPLVAIEKALYVAHDEPWRKMELFGSNFYWCWYA